MTKFNLSIGKKNIPGYYWRNSKSFSLWLGLVTICCVLARYSNHCDCDGVAFSINSSSNNLVGINRLFYFISRNIKLTMFVHQLRVAHKYETKFGLVWSWTTLPHPWTNIKPHSKSHVITPFNQLQICSFLFQLSTV